MNANQYYGNLEKALAKVSLIISAVENSVTDEFDTTNYSDILNKLYRLRRSIEQMLSAHKFYRLSKEAFIRKSEAKEGKRMEIEHEVRGFETASSIAKRYGIAVSELLSKNNILSSGITAGIKLKIELQDSKELTRIFDEIPVYGSQEGKNILGKDIRNDLKANEGGDLEVLSNEGTIKQGIENRVFTHRGDYPLADDFGIDMLVGSEIPNDLFESLHLIKIISQIKQDKRVADINDMSISRNQNAITITGNIRTINKEDLEI